MDWSHPRLPAPTGSSHCGRGISPVRPGAASRSASSLAAWPGLPVIDNNDANPAPLSAHHVHLGAAAMHHSPASLIVGTGPGAVRSNPFAVRTRDCPTGVHLLTAARPVPGDNRLETPPADPADPDLNDTGSCWPQGGALPSGRSAGAKAPASRGSGQARRPRWAPPRWGAGAARADSKPSARRPASRREQSERLLPATRASHDRIGCRTQEPTCSPGTPTPSQTVRQNNPFWDDSSRKPDHRTTVHNEASARVTTWPSGYPL